MQNTPLLLALGLVLQAGEMKPFTSPKGKFTINMPAKAVEKVRKLAISGQEVRLTVASSRQGAVTYAAGYADIPGSDAEAALSAAQDDVAKQNRGSVREDSETKLGGFPARAITIDVSKQIVAGGLVVQGRTLVVGDRLYVLTATVAASRASASEPEIQGYFQSFKAEKGSEVAARRAVAPRESPDSVKLADGIPAATGPLGASWKDFTIPGYQVTVKMPGMPSERMMADKGIPGVKPGKSYTSQKGDTTYKIIVSPISLVLLGETNLSLFFSGFKESSLRASNSTAISERKFKLGGHTVYELACQGTPDLLAKEPANIICMRAFIVKDTCITLGTSTPTGKAADPDLPGFFDSLRILEKAPEAEDKILWAKFAPPGRGFSVNLPGTPTESANTRSNAPDRNHIYETTRGSMAYLMAVGPLLPGSDANKFETSRDRTLQRYNLELRASKAITVEGNPGMEFVGQAPQNGPVMVMRFVRDLTARKSYILSVSGPGLTEESPEVRDFFDSFRPSGPTR